MTLIGFNAHQVLSGVPVRELPPHLDSRDDILRRYGYLPDV